MNIILVNASNLSFIPQQNYIITTYDELVTLSAFMVVIGFVFVFLLAWVSLKYGRLVKNV